MTMLRTAEENVDDNFICPPPLRVRLGIDKEHCQHSVGSQSSDSHPCGRGILADRKKHEPTSVAPHSGGRGILAGRKKQEPTSVASHSCGRGLLARKTEDEPVVDVSIRSRLRSNPPKTQHFITMSEAMEHINEHTHNIIVLPPVTGDQGSIPTDEEDFQDDEEECIEPAGEVELDDSDNSDDEELENPSHQRWRKHSTIEHDFGTSEAIIPMEEQYPLLATKSEFELWKEIFDDEIMALILRQTLLYGRRDKGDFNFQLSEVDLMHFLGILLLSGYHCVPTERNYWSNQPDLKVELASQTMSRDHFGQVKRFLHLADNHSLEEGNKLAKVTPLYNLLDVALQRFGIFHSDLSIDEAMVPYYGKHSAKMYMKGKPIRFGYKIWTLAGSDGYPYKSIIYKGRDPAASSMPLGFRVVKSLLSVVEVNSDPSKHNVVFDNFFTSHQLLVDLQLKNFKATGTIRSNRTNGAAKNLSSDKELKVKGRGSFDHRCDGKVFIAKWNDSSIVHVASNSLTHDPIQIAKRRIGKNLVNVQQPFLIKKYNEGMGGVDLLDRLLGSYRPTIMAKKWWWPLFINALNMSVVAAWRLHTQLHPTHQQSSHLDFRRAVTLCLLKRELPRPQVGGGLHPQLPTDIRFDGVGHDVVSTSQGRCVVCSTNTRSKCTKCDVRLHYSHQKPCYNIHHSK